MARNKETNSLWKGIIEKDFLEEGDRISDEEISEYDKAAMTYFSQNVNLMRHLPRLADSLKPVERRGLYALYKEGVLPNSKQKKSGVLTGNVTTYHPHGDSSVYNTLVGLAQPFNNPVPLIHGKGNFGNDEHPKGYAAMRYTEMRMSKYAFECFFKDYDDECVEKIFNTSKDDMEPMSLPSKFPNILVNGGFGIATGNNFCIPPYAIPDVVKLMKRLLRDPNADNIYMVPDVPTGCDIVDNGSLREICDKGTGTLRMRSTITIEENPRKPNIWILRVHNLPWMVSIASINDALAKLTKDGLLPIKDIEDHSEPIKTIDANGNPFVRKKIKYDIIINKAHDPNQIRYKLYKLTQLQKSISVNFKVVEDALSIGSLNMRDLCLTWIDTRREYKRRLLNKKISKITARIALLDILIYLTSENHLENTIRIIRTNDEKDAVSALMKDKHMKITSYQAERVVDMKLRAFSKDAHKKYVEEKKTLEKELKELKKMTKSSKIIDDIIDIELDDLMKYSTGRKCKIVEDISGVEIANTDHFVCITKQGMIKKLPYVEGLMEKKKTPALGAFKNHDYPLHGLKINNHDSLMLFDNFGRFSTIPVHEIENTEASQYGSRAYDSTKLSGEIVQAFQYMSEDLKSYIEKELEGTVSVVTLSKNGYLKRTPIEEFTKSRNQKGVRAMRLREGDELVVGKLVIDRKNDPLSLLLYTEKGKFAYIESDQIAEQSKDASGLLSIKLDPDDACKGICVIGNHDEYILVVTEKGMMKKCELGYLGSPGRRKVSSYLTTLEPTDKVYHVDGINDKTVVTVCTRTSYHTFKPDEIPTKTRKAKCVKMVPVPVGNNIISVTINSKKKRK